MTSGRDHRDLGGSDKKLRERHIVQVLSMRVSQHIGTRYGLPTSPPTADDGQQRLDPGPPHAGHLHSGEPSHNREN